MRDKMVFFFSSLKNNGLKSDSINFTRSALNGYFSRLLYSNILIKTSTTKYGINCHEF